MEQSPAMKKRESADDDLFGPEYSVVRLRANWTALAYVCTILTMSAKYWMRLFSINFGWRRPFVTVLVMLALSLVGTAAAWTAQRRNSSAINKIALLCNLVAIGLSVLAVVIVVIIVPSR
jgi:hypothetical protein